MKRTLAGLAAAALLLALALQGCATAPATGRSIFTGGLSQEDEIKLGREQHPKIVAEFGGAYDDPALQAYVASLGQLLARTSELPNLTWTFTVLDTPLVNAFALPGGYVYVTRGLLALADNEAELAGVLAHEIGHVTARHTAERYGQSVASSVAAAGVGILTGSSTGADLASGALGLAQLSYSRDQEFEADTLGVRYLARSGHDSGAMASFLSKLQAYSRYQAEIAGRPEVADAFDITQTHPRTAARIERAIQTAGVAANDNPIVAQDIYLQKIDGMVYGDSPSQGFIRGRRFSHPEFGFTFEVPEGFTLINQPQQVAARGPEGAAILFDLDQDAGYGPLTGYLANGWAKGRPLQDLQAITVNGLDAATGRTRLDGRGGPLDVRLVAISAGDGAAYRFLFATPPKLTAALDAPLRRTTYSFRRLTPREAADLKPLRLKVVRARRGDTAESLARAMPVADDPLRLFLVLNGLGAPRDLRPGQLVKVIAE